VTSGPPTRPATEADLGFTRRGRVRWFHPQILLEAGQRVLLSAAFGDFLDKRELQQSVPQGVLRHAGRSEEGEPLWFDFVADTGDGFDATYSVAWLTSQPELAVDPAGTGAALPGALPRGSLLVLGGDEVYPTGASSAYDDRFRGPFKAALPWSDETTEHLEVLAIPGNHDWYDGLTNFMRVFCAGTDRWIGGRRTIQSRSYFAVELAHDWWLWGIDIQFDAFLDEPQLQYFEDAAKVMGKGANLILCTAVPSWVDADADPLAFRNLGFLEDRVIRPAELRLWLSLSGDSHHYAHYYAPEDGTHRITAGGGGAFLSATHHLEDPIRVPTEPHGDDRRSYDLVATCPDQGTSRRLSAGALLLPWTNPQFMLVPGVLYLLLGWASQLGNRTFGAGGRGSFEEVMQRDGWFDHLLGLVRSSGSILMLAVVLVALIGFAKPSPDWSLGRRRSVMKVVMGSLHFAAQLAVGGAIGVLAVDLASVADGAWFKVLMAVALAVLGAIAASVALGAYLAVCCAFFRAHANEAFSSLALTRYKNFLRCRIDPDGVLTIYPVGIASSCRTWAFEPGAGAGASWLRPAEGALRPRLIDAPITIDPRVTATTATAATAATGTSGAVTAAGGVSQVLPT
jgi:hypothetical protein